MLFWAKFQSRAEALQMTAEVRLKAAFLEVGKFFFISERLTFWKKSLNFNRARCALSGSIPVKVEQKISQNLNFRCLAPTKMVLQPSYIRGKLEISMTNPQFRWKLQKSAFLEILSSWIFVSWNPIPKKLQKVILVGTEKFEFQILFFCSIFTKFRNRELFPEKANFTQFCG